MTDEEKPIAKFLRLQNGDDVIGEVVETEDEEGITYTLFHPLKVVYVPSETDGYLSVSFMPWIFPSICEQQEFVINSEDIMLIVDVSTKMNTYYWDSVDTYMNKKKNNKRQEEEKTDMSPEEELELFKRIMEHMGTKRTFH